MTSQTTEQVRIWPLVWILLALAVLASTFFFLKESPKAPPFENPPFPSEEIIQPFFPPPLNERVV